MPLVIQIQSKILLLVCHPKMLSNLIRIASNNWIRTHTASYWGHNDYHWNTTKILATYLIQSIGRVLCCWCSGLSRCPKQTCPGFILTLLATRNSIKKKAQNVHILIWQNVITVISYNNYILTEWLVILINNNKLEVSNSNSIVILILIVLSWSYLHKGEVQQEL